MASLPAKAQDFQAFSGSSVIGVGTLQTNLHAYVIPASAAGTPQVQFIDVSSDNATNVIRFLYATNGYGVTAAGDLTSNVTAVVDAVTTNDTWVIKYTSRDEYQRLTVLTNSATNVTFQTVFARTPSSGDRLYPMKLGGTIWVGDTWAASGTTNKQFNAGAGAIWNGKPGYPNLVEIWGKGSNTTATVAGLKLNVVSGIYRR